MLAVTSLRRRSPLVVILGAMERCQEMRIYTAARPAISSRQPSPLTSPDHLQLKPNHCIHTQWLLLPDRMSLFILFGRPILNFMILQKRRSLRDYRCVPSLRDFQRRVAARRGEERREGSCRRRTSCVCSTSEYSSPANPDGEADCMVTVQVFVCRAGRKSTRGRPQYEHGY